MANDAAAPGAGLIEGIQFYTECRDFLPGLAGGFPRSRTSGYVIFASGMVCAIAVLWQAMARNAPSPAEGVIHPVWAPEAISQAVETV